MFSKKKETKRPRPVGSLAQYGIFEVPDNIEDIGKDLMGDENDEDLEAELAALTGDSSVNKKNRRNASRKPVSDINLDAMVAESMRDIQSDEDISEGDDDPALLDELKMITEDGSVSPKDISVYNDNVAPPEEKANTDIDEIIKSLQERLTLYEAAESKAKRKNEPGKARRYNRAMKTLKELLATAEAGGNIDETDIPPVLPPSATAETPEPSPQDSPDEPETTPVPEDNSQSEAIAASTVVNEETLALLKKRQQEYKVAAVAWKKAGNMEEALNHVKIAKQFDIVVEALSAGETIDLSDMPPTPNLPSDAPSPKVEKEESEIQQQPSEDIPAAAEPELPRHGIEDLESALKERLEMYRRTKTAAETEGNSSKARRYGRICKQFEDALKLHAHGKPVPLDELPVPPGFPPLTTPQPAPPETVNDQSSKPPLEPKPPENEPLVSPQRKPPVPPPRPNAAVRKQNQKVTSRAEKQLMQLQQRQHELKQAALTAKTDGDIELARDYLRQAKGMQPLIEASKSGLPVDMNTIPLSPLAKLELNTHDLSGQVDDNFMLVYSEDCTEVMELGGTDEQIYENLETQLVKQIKWCLSTRDHSKALGDVPGYNKWERLALAYTRDLNMLQVRKRDSLPPPLHHYETKTYAIVQSCTELNDSDIEISIIRGTNYVKEADTYVMFEFPYPSDNPPADRTSTVRGTINPEYQAVFPLTGIIDRTSRQCQRAFKRHALKCQVWAKGGFFRSDNLLGTVTVKLQPLETQCTLHDSFPLMEGRKSTGGKLEVKIRLRNPIVTKQIDQITDKWLIIDQ